MNRGRDGVFPGKARHHDPDRRLNTGVGIALIEDRPSEPRQQIARVRGRSLRGRLVCHVAFGMSAVQDQSAAIDAAGCVWS